MDAREVASLRAELQQVADSLQGKYEAALKREGGQLSVSVSRVSNLRRQTKEIELFSRAEWEDPPPEEHVEALVAERRWFSGVWRQLMTVASAEEKVESAIIRWLSEGRERTASRSS
jgi:hypothetical protein